MTITLQTVNELIASLESAGELSIREQKFLKLAKAFKQLAAENKRLTDVAQGGAFVMQKALMEYEFGAGMTMQAEDFIRDAREKHSATDAYLAGIKADGVEEFAAYQRAITEEWACKEGHSSLLKVAESAELFSKQLREGADK